MLTLVWRASAVDDVETIFAYIARHNVAAADQLKAAIMACAEQLPRHPLLYRAGRAEGTREAIVHPNYILIYRVSANMVEIVRVIHARREYP
ncbi:type II toxin-antitoxin system RelE/ParE family toxin [Sphingobium phenoxybenzoativorans]|uniref:type II toxin-antitoxin system RelE/ParE family toxin n=1 Tax=Sphingobium phenoxybenzoativorans TaxID=1592790 RepID=UPI000873367B|nr:type II toxin-antitoxin system RelE/ParE family toxin [Sphingobium phenoxybenzoativorans]